MNLLEDFINLHVDLINLKKNKKKSKICLNKECKKEASYNYKNYKILNFRKYIYCKSHKLKIMTDIKNKKCVKCSNKQPIFNYKNENKALYCGDCKETDMIDIVNKKCVKCSNKIPTFNYKNEKIALYCGDCKETDMIDIVSKKCTKCKIKHPAFNYKNKKIPIYCGDCKEIDMINIVSKKCIICNNKQPGFNYKNEKIALYCGDCKETDMINIKSKKCIKCKNKTPAFNYKNKKKSLYCGDCKEIDMVNVKNKKCIDCKIKQPTYNYENEKQPLYCGDCKEIDMINIKDRRCKTELYDTLATYKHLKGYCLRCYIYTFPNDKIVRDYGTREAKVSQFIKETYVNLNITYNKAVDGGSSSHRPDILIDILTYSVIIEIDENQHKASTYTPECNKRRINNLFTDLGDRPIVFIRFNPDSYINSKNKLIKGCFEYTEERGLPKATKTLQTRLKKLKKIIDENLIKVPTEHITTIKLYYDGFK